VELIRPKKKVLVAIPDGAGHVSSSIAKFMFDLGLLNGDPSHPFIYDKLFVSCFRPVDFARNQIVKIFREARADYLMMLDDDMEVPENWQLLLTHYNRKAVSGVAFGWESSASGRREPRIMPVQYNRNAAGVYETIEISSAEPFECDAVGAACLILRHDLIESVGFPWFKFKYNDDGSIAEGEDVGFFRTANDLGERVLIDPRVMFGHNKTSDTLDVLRYGMLCRRRALKERTNEEVQVAQG
jgi:GT2 family glycosyltransferase